MIEVLTKLIQQDYSQYTSISIDYVSVSQLKIEQRFTFEKCGCRVSFRVQNHTDTVLLSPAAVMRFGGP